MPAEPVYNVLFLCTGNSARSVMGEALLNRFGSGHFRAYSAGSHPKGTVHPLTLKVLAAEGLPVDNIRSKSWDEFSGPDAPKMDFVFTVCDDAAKETCPIWPGHPMTAHWGIEDPAALAGTPVSQEAAFIQAFKYMRARVQAFTALPLKSIDRMALNSKLREIGNLEGSTSGRGSAA